MRSHSCLVGLVLGGLNLGLQVGRWVEVLALLARAAALDVVHADGDRVVAGVDHRAVARVGEAAVGLTAGAVSPLKLTADLRAGERGATAHTHTHRETDTQAHTHVNAHADVCMHEEKTKKYTQKHKKTEYLSFMFAQT